MRITKILFVALLLIMPFSFMAKSQSYPGHDQTVNLQISYSDPTKPGPHNPKSPALTPTVYINENTVSFGSELEGFTLKILDEDGVVVYSTVIAAGVSQVVLPSTLSGEYEIRFVTDDYYYYGFITL